MKLAFVTVGNVFRIELIIVIYIGVLIGFTLSWILAVFFIQKGSGRGVFIQGSFRGNEAIVGMALIISFYGDQATAKVATILIFLIPLFNILSIIALTFSDTEERKNELKTGIISLVRNPLLIAIFVSILVSIYSVPVPRIIRSTGESLAAIAIPLALIGIGSSLDFKQIKNFSAIAFAATAFKLILMPVLGTVIAYIFGIRGESLGIVYILFACPTAIVSYIMAEAMGKHGKIAGNIVVFSTTVSMLTIGIGLYLLRLQQLI
jgi:predicted permease